MAAPPTLPRQQIRYARILDAAAGFARKGLDSVSLSEGPPKPMSRWEPCTGTFLPPPTSCWGCTGNSWANCRWKLAGIGGIKLHSLAGVVMEIFHMRLMQPAVEQCLSQSVYAKDKDTTVLLREIDVIAEQAVTVASGDAAKSRVLSLTVSGLVQVVRCRRLSLFEAEEDLKKACSLLTRCFSSDRVTGLDH